MKAIQLRFNSSTTIYFNYFEGYDPNKTYNIIFYEKVGDDWIESMNDVLEFKPGYYYSFFRRFFHNLKVELIGFDEYSGWTVIDSDEFDPFYKNVQVILDTESKHETYLWIEQSLEFGRKWNCQIYISCNLNFLNRAKDIYKDAKFETEGIDFYATYRIGRYDVLAEGPNLYGMQIQNKGWVSGGCKIYRSFGQPRDWKFLHSEQIARDILGLSENQSFNMDSVDCDWFINTLQIKDDNFKY
jgi:hypothetical protein